MKEFSLEILRFISEYLTVKDLKQFQLVNKCCYEASVETLYSTVTLIYDRQIAPFIRTISNSQSLGKHVKSISTSKCFNQESDIWDEENFLDAVIEYCCNLCEISFDTTPTIIWTKLMFAANQGKLLNLQRLPLKHTWDIDTYVYTALCFKKSLTVLNLWDFAHVTLKSDHKHTKACQYLRNRIKEFSNLKHLSILRHTDRPFNHLDTLIDDCLSLTELTIELYPSNLGKPVLNQNILAPPRPDILKVTCSWTNIYDEDQLKYIMRKFPNLRYLIIRPNFFGNPKPNRGPLSDDVMMEFMVYISAIKELELSLDTTREELGKHWIKFIQLRKKEMSKVRIVYTPYFPSTEIQLKYNKKILDVSYTITTIDTTLPHEDFLREHGSTMKSLAIAGTFATNDQLDERSIMKKDILCNENWIYQTLQLCPSLQDLTLENLVDLKLSSNNGYQHFELKRLKIIDTDDSTALKFLRNFSIRTPNLKHLHLFKYYKIKQRNCYFIKIDMPYTSFDSITVQFEDWKYFLEEYHIKLNTIFKEKYFVVDEDGTHELPSTIYYQSEKPYLIEITCLGLKQFTLRRPERHRSEGDFISISDFE